MYVQGHILHFQQVLMCGRKALFMAVNKDKFVLARFQYVSYTVQPAIVVYLYILLHIAYNHCHAKEVVSQVVQLLFFITFVYIVDIFMHCECVLIPDNSKVVAHEFIAKGQILISKSCFRSTFNKYHCVHRSMLKITHHSQYCTINYRYTFLLSGV